MSGSGRECPERLCVTLLILVNQVLDQVCRSHESDEFFSVNDWKRVKVVIGK